MSMKKILHSLSSFFIDIVKEFDDTSCPTRAAALSYTTLLSLVPLMSLGFAIMSAFPVYQQYGERIQSFIFDNFVAGSATIVQKQLTSFTAQASQLSATGILFLLITAVLMIFTMENSFNTIWHVKERRHGVTAFLIYWAVLTLMPILIGVGFAVSSYFLTLPFFTDSPQVIQTSVIQLFPYALTWAAFCFIYVALPNKKVLFRHAIVGSFVAMVFFELAKYGFGLYIIHFPTYELIYGALASIPIFLVWVYLSWMIILFGAVISHVLSKTTQEN